MIVILVYLIAAGLLAGGFWLRVRYNHLAEEEKKELTSKNREGEVVKPGRNCFGGGTTIAVIVTIASFIASLGITGGAVSLEATYDSYLAYSEEEVDDALVIRFQDLREEETGKRLYPDVTIDAVTFLENTIEYNSSLYCYRYFSKNLWVGVLVPTPDSRLKPVIVKF